MRHSSTAAFAGITGLLLAMTSAIGAPAIFPSHEIATGRAPVVQARARVARHVRQSGPGPAAMLGLFGALAGAAISNNRYENYSYQSYGYANDYYAPRGSYGYAPQYGGDGYRRRGWRR